MQRPYTAQAPTGNRIVGLVLVIVLHIGLVYALMAGLGRTVIDVVKGPLETEIIEEQKIEPPETPPPPPPPKLETPPPPFIPPPEIQVALPPPKEAVIAAVSTAKPPPAPEQSFKPAPPAPPAPTGGGIDQKSIGLPDYPSMSIRLEEEGVVILTVFCGLEGRVTDAQVATTSKFTRLDEQAVKHFKRGRVKCTPPTMDGQPVAGWLPFRVPLRFRLDDAR